MATPDERLKRLKELQARTTIIWREWFNEYDAIRKLECLEKYQLALKEEDELRKLVIEDGGY